MVDVDAYLARIGARRDSPLDVLMARHLEAVPSENLSIHLGEDIRLDATSLFDKIVARRRGGFCYELNGAFALLLEGLGHSVTRLAARVATEDGFGPPGDHLTLVVDDGGRRLLIDVGFGRFTHGPLDLDDRGEQIDRGGVFVLRDAPDGDLDIVHDGQVVARLEPHPRSMADLEPMCWWHATSPRSPFTQSIFCTRVTPTGRVTLTDDRMITTPDGGERTEHPMGPTDLLAAYRSWFGIELDALPRVRHPRAGA